MLHVLYFPSKKIIRQNLYGIYIQPYKLIAVVIWSKHLKL